MQLRNIVWVVIIGLTACATTASPFDAERAVVPSWESINGHWILESADGKPMDYLRAERHLTIYPDSFGFALDDCNQTSSVRRGTFSGVLRSDEDAITTTAGCRKDFQRPEELRGAEQGIARGMRVTLDPVSNRLQLQGDNHRLVFRRP